MKKFEFPATSTQEQVDILLQKGLIIGDREDARIFLDYIPYSKVLSYMAPYRCAMERQLNGEALNDPITREKIKSTYLFDHKMRVLFFEYLSFIELGIKSMFINVSCDKCWGAHWRVEEENFSSGELPLVLKQYKDALDYYWKQYHTTLASYEQYLLENNIEEWEALKDKNVKNKTIKAIKEQLKNADSIREESLKTIIKILDKESVKRYIEKYNDPCYPPIRNIIEELTFGDVTYLINSVISSVKKRMFHKIDISKDGFESWLKSLVDLRNICCHHWKLYTHSFSLHHDLLKKIIPYSPDQNIQDVVVKYHNFFITYHFICYVLDKVDPKLKGDFISRIHWELKNKRNNKMHLLQEKGDVE